MARLFARVAWICPLVVLSLSPRSYAQTDSSASFPQDPQPAPAPAPAAQPAPADAPVAQPAPAPAPAPEPAPAEAPPPAYAPAPAEPTAPPAAYEPNYPPPPPPEAPRGEGFKMPPFSVRIDPFNWLLHGKLGFELEVAVLDFMSVELVPEFVVNEQPPSFNFFAGREDPLYRESDGIGPLSGTSIGLGFWLEGKALHGYVLRAILTNYSYHYVARDAAGEFDNVSHVERHFYGFFGSNAVWGVFTLGGGIGLGVELNREKRCFRDDGTATRSGCPDSELLIKAQRWDPSIGQENPVFDLGGGLGGVQLLGRISLGVTID